MKNSIFTRIFLFILIILFLFSGALFIFSYNFIQQHFIAGIRTELQNTSVLIQTYINNYSIHDMSDIDMFIKETGKSINRRITIIDIEGNVIADSDKDIETMENHKTRPEIQQALKYGFGKSVRYSSTLNMQMMYIAVPYEDEGEVNGVIRTSIPQSELNALYRGVIVYILITNIILIIIALIIAYFYARSLTRPLNRIVNAAQSVSEGDFDIHLFPSSDRQINHLTNGFNTMVEEINKLFTKTNKQQELQKRILATIADAIMLIGEDDNIIMSNRQCGEIFNYNNDGNKYYEHIKSHELLEIIKQTRNGRSLQRYIMIDNEHYSINSVLIESTGEILLDIYNISDMKRAEIMKKELIQNVSHELRTPLTAIKGFIETIEDSQNKENSRYVHIIKNHTERLIHIVSDLAVLSEIEDSSNAMEIKNIDIVTFLQNEMDIFRTMTGGRDLTINLHTDESSIQMDADTYRLEQVFVNLLENAIKYTPKGHIDIKITKKDNTVCIDISDTGIGVPDGDKSRIFERFYVVDKARTRQNGGTGLGLAIVKHIVELHNGSIEVNDNEGGGTVFSLIFPIRQQ